MTKKVEFESKALGTIEKKLLVKPNEEEVQHLDDKKKWTIRITIQFC